MWGILPDFYPITLSPLAWALHFPTQPKSRRRVSPSAKHPGIQLWGTEKERGRRKRDPEEQTEKTAENIFLKNSSQPS